MTDSLHPLTQQSPDAVAARLMQRVHNLDGLPEIAIGLFFLLLSCLLFAQVVLPHQSIGFKASCIASAFLMPLVGFGSPRAILWVRSRYLVERTGYMRPRPVGLKQIGIGVLILGIVSVVLFGVVPQLSQPDRWLLAGSGIFAGAIAAFGGRNIRFAILGAMVSVAGILVAFSGISLTGGFALLWGFAGLLFLCSGCVGFVRFIRQPTEAGE